MSILVSVVVPTYRRPYLLDRCLQALVSQAFAPDAFEIIVVDDAADEVTRRVIVEWQQYLQNNFAFLVPPLIKRIPVTGSSRLESATQTDVLYEVHPGPANYPHIRYLPAEGGRHGPAAARNRGWHAARGEIIAFTDDDTIPDPHWLASGVSSFAGGVAGVSGRVIVPLPKHPTDNEVNTTGLETSHFVTANCFYRRSALEAVGGFDEDFAMAWREDSDLYFTLREREYPLAWSSSAIVVHPVRPERWGSSLRTQKKSFYNALLYKKHPELYRRYIQARPPWHYYGMLGFLVVALVGGVTGIFPAAMIGLAGWLGLVIGFILGRLAHTSHAPAHVAEMVVTSLVIPFLSVYWRIRGAIRWKVFFL
jgi:cellulose synthase/poly-beta-1,6-N-acetylglucosamine synthase-like glycosyltransferase